MTCEHLAIIGRSGERPAPNAGARCFGRHFRRDVIGCFLGQCHRHASLDERAIDIDLARLADREDPTEPVDPALLAGDLLRSDKLSIAGPTTSAEPR
jgi:hypothetical protein